MKFRLSILALALGLGIFQACKHSEEGQKSKYTYETVDGDPLGAKIYTFPNGLKLYMSENHDEPRVVAQIAVRTGSKQDPADATGLAHYLEHMLFKGTSDMGTKDWETESAYLKQISDLYETHRNTTDPAQRKSIYGAIDSISGLAAEIAIANEYDKMVSSLGAQGTNAYTWYEQTVYINDIPSNELEKWANLESERFSELVLRLFHTELEAVYEEFNRTQDSDNRRAYYLMMEELFKNHPYGTQTTIGTSEHLKNPSMEKIHAYFKERYVPNNMAIVLSGDINPDECVALIEKTFGDYERAEVPEFKFTPEAPIAAAVVKDVTGVQPEFVTIGYRLNGIASDDALKLKVLDGILSNGQAGLIDLNLVQKQTVLQAYSSPTSFTDYSMLTLTGNPREGQDLEEVGNLLRAQIELVKQGEFEDWMIEAVVNNLKLNELRQTESNWARASKMVNAFIYGQPWETVVGEYDKMGAYSKQEIMDFAKANFNDNYVQINKRQGKNNAVKVEKPTITAVNIDRESQSKFFLQWDSLETGRIEPIFVDYKAAIKTEKLPNGLELNTINNDLNELFSLYYIFDMGSDNDLKSALAIEYLPYLGTSSMSAEDLQKEMFRLGITFDVSASRDQSYVVLSGLNSSLEEGLKLFENILSDVQSDQTAYSDMVDGVMKRRQDAMKNKGQILQSAMMQYAQYGKDSPKKNLLSDSDLAAINPDELVAKIKELTSFEHRIFYYGPEKTAKLEKLLADYHKVPAEFKAYPEAKTFEELEIANNKVYFVDYDMVQSEMMMVSKGPTFELSMAPSINLFNEYFGSGLSSMVFQEIRESKALAYSAYAYYGMPRKADESHYTVAYIGAQVDKLPEATSAMLELMNNMPRADIQFESARDAAMKKIETNRTSREDIYWSYEAAKRRGLDYDLNRMVYDSLKTINFDKLQGFFDQQIKGQNYTFCVIGNENMVDKSTLEKLGTLEVLSLEEVFGYPANKAPDNLVKN